MEFFAELLFSFVGEFLLQFVFELLADLGFRVIAESAQSARRSQVMRLLGYLCLGAMAGGLSLLIFPNHMVHDTWFRVAILAIVPVLAGWLMSLIGNRRAARGRSRSQLESWANGYFFALAMGLVRFCFAK